MLHQKKPVTRLLLVKLRILQSAQTRLNRSKVTKKTSRLTAASLKRTKRKNSNTPINKKMSTRQKAVLYRSIQKKTCTFSRLRIAGYRMRTSV